MATTVKKGPTLSAGTTWPLVFLCIAICSGFGYYAGNLPEGSQWRLFSWHPFLMSSGAGCYTAAALIKKLGGYSNTKLHGSISSLGVFLMLGGLYAIYENKNRKGKEHFTSIHSQVGLIAMLSFVVLMIVGAAGLHPDFGAIKTNQNVRFIHKSFGRIANCLVFVVCVTGLNNLTDSDSIKGISMLSLGCVAVLNFI